MTAYQYPGEVFPGPPRISITAPGGWEAVATPDSLMKFVDPRGPEQPTTIVVRATRMQRGVTLEQATARARAALERRVAEYRGLASARGEVGGSPATIITQAFRARPAEPPRFRVAVLVEVNRDDERRHLIRIEGNCLASAADDLQAVFKDTLASVTFA